MKRENDILRIDVVLEEVIGDGTLKKGMDAMAVKEAWQSVMGNGVVSYTDDLTLKKGLLIVKLSSSTLREELSYGKNKIVDLLNKHLKKDLITSIKLT